MLLNFKQYAKSALCMERDGQKSSGELANNENGKVVGTPLPHLLCSIFGFPAAPRWEQRWTKGARAASTNKDQKRISNKDQKRNYNKEQKQTSKDWGMNQGCC